MYSRQAKIIYIKYNGKRLRGGQFWQTVTAGMLPREVVVDIDYIDLPWIGLTRHSEN